jgi:hypothetical protein
MATIDDVLAADYLEGLRELSLDEVRAKRRECQEVELALSYERRLVQGRLDIVGAEIRRRSGGDEDLHVLVEDLKDILAERVRSPGPGRLPSVMAPALDDALVAEVESSTDSDRMASLGQLDDDGLHSLAEDLGQLEHRLSDQRRQVHERIDATQAEVVRRYKEGEASIEGLLSS